MSKVLVMIILAVIAYNVLSGSDIIKNTGTLVTGARGGEPVKAPQVQVQAQIPSPMPSSQTLAPAGATHDDVYKTNPNVLPNPQMSNNFASQGNFLPNSCQGPCELTAADLLPASSTGFAESNPTPQGSLSNRNLFESGHHAGLNTQLNSLRNGNRQLRSDPLIPRVSVGPWGQSTYEADTNRREFEISGI